MTKQCDNHISSSLSCFSYKQN